jgi:hypothetical protein
MYEIGDETIKRLLDLDEELEVESTVVAVIGTDGVVLYSDDDQALTDPCQDITSKVQGATFKSMDSDMPEMPYQANIKIDPVVMTASTDKIKETLDSHGVAFDMTSEEVITPIEDPDAGYAYTDEANVINVK